MTRRGRNADGAGMRMAAVIAGGMAALVRISAVLGFSSPIAREP